MIFGNEKVLRRCMTKDNITMSGVLNTPVIAFMKHEYILQTGFQTHSLILYLGRRTFTV